MDRGTAVRSLRLACVCCVFRVRRGACGVDRGGRRRRRRERRRPRRRHAAGAGTESLFKIATRILGRAPRGLAKTIVERSSILVANDANYPPYSSVYGSTGEVEGFDVDVARGIAAILGVAVELRHPAWDWVSRGLVARLFRRVHRQRGDHAPAQENSGLLDAVFPPRCADSDPQGRTACHRTRLAARQEGGRRPREHVPHVLARQAAATPVAYADYSPAVRALLKHDVPMYLTSGVVARLLAGRDEIVWRFPAGRSSGIAARAPSRKARRTSSPSSTTASASSSATASSARA